MRTIKEIRDLVAQKYKAAEFVNGTVELIGESFIADQPTIIGKVNDDYVRRELNWYLSESLNVNDIEGKTPAIWKAHATPDGLINSNYGYLTMSRENGSQFSYVLLKLIEDPTSRQATMIYTRPTMHQDWNEDGMSDFVCTNTVQYLMRNGKLDVVVQMRSNDIVFGYRNDYAWQKYMQDQLVFALQDVYHDLEAGTIYWNAASLHVYERHYPLIEKYIATGIWDEEL
jgi:thymidylate synthase